MSDLSDEALYQQGMAHYQRREWQPALDCFRRLKAAQPTWPGLDALIDEVSWFLQLEELGGEESPEEADARLRGARLATRRRRLAWQGLLLMALFVAALFLVWRQVVPGGSQGLNEAQRALYNRGQASLAAGDYDAAQQAFAELVALAPNNAAAQEGLRLAYQLEALARARQQAQAALEAGDWAAAEARLTEILAADPTDREASQQLAYVRRQQEAARLFAEGVAAYDARDLANAIRLLEQVADLAPDYQPDAVRELLFVLYLQEGRALLAAPGADLQAVRQALGRFGQALALRPRNVEAARESRLAGHYLNARLAFDRQDWSQARSLLTDLVAAQADYAGGQAAELLYQILVRQGDEARTQGRLDEARRAYEEALALPPQVVPDRRAAQAGLQALLPTSAPTPMATGVSRLVPQPTLAARVATPTLNVRLGPGTDYPLVGQVALGDSLALIGRNEAGDWLVVCCVDGKPGWVAARLVSVEPAGADVTTLPVALAPARPQPPAPTATPTATPTVAAAPAVPSPGDTGNVAPPPPPPPPPTATPTPVPR